MIIKLVIVGDRYFQFHNSNSNVMLPCPSFFHILHFPIRNSLCFNFPSTLFNKSTIKCVAKDRTKTFLVTLRNKVELDTLLGCHLEKLSSRALAGIFLR